MSNYIITSPLEINSSSSLSPELIFDIGINSINLQAPSTLSSNYNFILPPDIGTQGQVLTLDSSLATEWNDNVSGVTQQFNVSDAFPFTGNNPSFVKIPNMGITPPTGTYFCIFNGQVEGGARSECRFSVDSSGVNESIRRIDSSTNEDTVFTTAVITVDGTEEINVQSRVASLIGVYTIGNRTLIIYRVN